MEKHKTRLQVALFYDGRAQYDIARAAGINETRLSRIAAGRIVPNEEEKVRIAAALSQRAEELFDDRGGAQ